jgi:hypothetical protein
MHVEHPLTTQRANALADHLEPQTQALRALNDAMALVCEQLLAPCQGRRPLQTDPVSESERAEQ